MSVAGIDLSTHSIDIVVLDDETDAVVQTAHVPVQQYMEGWPIWSSVRALSSVFPTHHWFHEHGVWLVGLEDPMSIGKGVVKKLALVTGAVLTLLPRSVTVIPLPPDEWKKETCGVPKAKKPEVAAWVGRTWPSVPAVVSQDTLDAYAIAYAARAVNGRAVEAAG